MAPVEVMARVMPPHIRAAIVMLAGSGLRTGELRGWKVSDVDFKAGAIRVERHLLQSGKSGSLKAAKSRRTVPVGEVVTDVLLTHLAALPSKEWQFTMEEGDPSTSVVGRRSGMALAGRSRQRRAKRLSARPASGRATFRLSLSSLAERSTSRSGWSSASVRRHHTADLRAPLGGRRRPHPGRHGHRARRHAGRVRTG